MDSGIVYTRSRLGILIFASSSLKVLLAPHGLCSCAASGGHTYRLSRHCHPSHSLHASVTQLSVCSTITGHRN
ncbi:hypothetical protein B0H19DRAFT_1106127 [Mycena capillaripes]|nr:hypothetical protein B0H19DRAFT_1106127 [Mycena capillaripes]